MTHANCHQALEDLAKVVERQEKEIRELRDLLRRVDDASSYEDQIGRLGRAIKAALRRER